ncbi:hypothetical protein [Nocardia sp. XZ_19_231]|uniref:hypothetical protein n=1 Tax=Nocardia sp. XZ_19_231 TaxID=2769252 RepID=UPI00189015CA|nr:hypothetical protein [Nocardia sp. XZ_19_231]
MADIEIEAVPRFRGWVLIAVGILASVAVVVGACWLANAAELFEDVTTTTTVTNQGVTSNTRIDSTALVTAQWATVVLMVVGALLFVGGFVLALADLTKTNTVASGIGEEGGHGLGPINVGAILPSVVDLGKELAAALKDVKSSTALVVVGAVLMVFGGLVAWHTAPGLPSAPTSTSGVVSTAPSTPGR